MIAKTCILFCRCGANVISSSKTDQLADRFSKLDVDVFELKDLCAFSVREKDVLQTIGKNYTHKIVIACYPRAVKNMLRQGGVDLGRYEVLNFKELSVDEILEQLYGEFQLSAGEARYQVQVSDLDVPAWYPVIDESRCTLCGQCARFCLFGVYSYNKKALKVISPLACKNNCPACGRTCPTSAIMFPRLAEQSTLAGAEPGAESKSGAGKQSSLFVRLNERNQVRKNIFKQGVVQMAEEERRKALEQFRKSEGKTE
jgi:heterodisulfide reductase subunit A-like polyferredoxin